MSPVSLDLNKKTERNHAIPFILVEIENTPTAGNDSATLAKSGCLSPEYSEYSELYKSLKYINTCKTIVRWQHHYTSRCWRMSLLSPDTVKPSNLLQNEIFSILSPFVMGIMKDFKSVFEKLFQIC